MNTRITRPLVESALLAALGAVMMLLAWYLPVVGTLIAFVSPLPVAVTVIRHGIRWGVLSSIVTMFVVAMFVGWLVAIALWAVNGAMGISFGFAVRRRYRPTVVLGAACVGSLAASVAEFAGAFFISGLTITQQVDELLATMQRAVQMSKDMMGPNPALDQLMAYMTREQFFRIMPATLVLGSILLAYVNFEIFRRILPRLGYSMDPMPPFSRWIFPEILAHAGIISYLVVAFQSYYNVPIVAQAAENIFSVTTMLSTMEAVAVAAFFMLRSGVARAMVGLVLFMGVSFILTTPGLGLLAALFGMIDVLFDFRHIRFQPVDEL